MIDWNWLWVAGELGLSYGFYVWWKSDDKFLAVLEVGLVRAARLSRTHSLLRSHPTSISTI